MVSAIVHLWMFWNFSRLENRPIFVRPQRLGERRAAAVEAPMTRETFAARPFDLKLDGSILEGLEYRIDSRLITRPLCLKPLEDLCIDP